MAWAVSLMRLRRPGWRASARRFSGCAMPCSTRIQCAECALRGHSYISSYQSGAFFLNLQGGGVTDTSAGMYARTLVADIRGVSAADPSARSLTSPNWHAWVMSAQLAGWVELHRSARSSPSVTIMDLTAFCLLLPEMISSGTCALEPGRPWRPVPTASARNPPDGPSPHRF